MEENKKESRRGDPLELYVDDLVTTLDTEEGEIMFRYWK